MPTQTLSKNRICCSHPLRLFVTQNRLFFIKPEDDTRPPQTIRKNGIRKGDALLILSLNIKSTVF
ncbi:MAG TPA: hypothetical protein DEB48_07925 [Verrucomicrobiales bacterium]|nr:hypothetical protein [Verrucomicrobiales bacterium]